MYDILYNPTNNNIKIEGYKPQFNKTFKPKEVSEEKQELEIIDLPLDAPEVTVTEQPHTIYDQLRATSKYPTTEQSRKYSDKQQFLSDMVSAYTKALSINGINPEYARYLAIQDALESSFGSKYTGKYNYGNIIVGNSKRKGTKGKDKDAYGRTITQNFRDYDSLEDYVQDKINLLKGSRYKAFTGDVKDFYSRVKAGGYATASDYVDNLNSLYNQYFPIKAKSGGKIYIKPENRGKFTALKKRTGHSSTWFKEHGTPAQKKMAVFALNARKWKHQDGGVIAGEDQDLLNFTKSFETFHATPYVLNGQTLIGYGSANPELIKKGKITEEEASKELSNHYNRIEKLLKQRINTWDKLSSGVKRALLDSAYNMGEQKVFDSKKLMNLLDSGVTDSIEIAKELDHNKNTRGWLGIRSASRRAMARDAYDYNWKNKDKYGRPITDRKSPRDWENSPYYFFNKPAYEEWIKTVNPNFQSSEYDLKTAYEKLPYEDLEFWRMNPERNHLPSGVETGNEFRYLKSKMHPSILHEYMWEYNTPEGIKWRSQWQTPYTYEKFQRLKRK